MNNKTTVLKENKPGWYFVDATDKTLGRLSVEIAEKLIGKDKANFSYRANAGDKVVVTNAAKILVTGNKLKDKKYYRHTQYPGGLKVETLQGLLSRKPEEVIRKAVKGMLPKNKLQKVRINNLYIYKDEKHPHKGQENA